MKTSAQWWQEVKADPAKFTEWLQKQYRGEVTAANRLNQVINHFGSKGELNDKNDVTLYAIMLQEATHASWIKDLLEDLGIEPKADVENSEKRYWSTQDLSFKDFSKTMAVAAHAEKMRLERIETIANDESADPKVRKVFVKILADEQFHERAFREMAGQEAMVNTEADHEEGRKLLGLVA